MLRRFAGMRGLALALALSLGLVLTSCIGPTVTDGLGKAGPYNVTLKIDPPTMQAGQKATLNYFFTDPANADKPVTSLAIVHERPLHVFVVDRELAYFKHDLSPGPAPQTNAYPVNVLFGHEGTYHVFAEFAPTIIVTDTATGKKTAKAGDTIIYTSTLSFGTAGRVEEEPAPLNEDLRPKAVQGVTVALSATTPLRVGQQTTFTFNLSERGAPINTLALYLGEAGHLIIVDAEAQHLAHEHALESMNMEGTGATGGPGGEPGLGGGTGATSGNPGTGTTPLPNGTPVAGVELGTPTAGIGVETPTATTPANTPTLPPGVLPTVPPPTSLGGGTYGPTITFEHTFEEPGLYKMWAQFLYRGNVLTADYVVNVAR